MPRIVFILSLLLLAKPAWGQVYTPVAVTGFNQDVVAEGSGSSALSTTSQEMDAVPISNFVMCTREFADANSFSPGGIYGLPDDGLLTTTDRSFQFASFSGNNVLYLFPTEEGTLTLTTPARFSHLSLLALSTEGASTIQVRFTFSDGSQQTENKPIFDWFDNVASPFTGYGRLKRKDGPFTAGFDYAGAENGKPVFAMLDFTLPCTKTLTSIAITNTSTTFSSTSFRSFIMAVSGAEVTLTPTIQVAATDTTICEGTTIDFNATALNGGTSPVYQWKVNNTPVGTNSNTYSSQAWVDGDVVTCTITSNLACAAPATVISKPIKLRVKPLLIPEDSIAASADSICQGTPVTFQAFWKNGGPNPEFRWSLNNQILQITSSSFTHDSLKNGDRVRCQLISNAECLFMPSAFSNFLEMQVTPVYQLTLNPMDTLNTNDIPVTLVAQPPGGVFSGNGVAGNQFNPTQVEPGKHTITYRFPDNACTEAVSTDVVVRKLPCDLTPVSLFTPNGDGRNDRWEIGIFNTACILKARATVYNRWGKEVFSTEAYGNNWDGKMGSEELREGVYFYIITYTTAGSTTDLVKTGTLTLAR